MLRALLISISLIALAGCTSKPIVNVEQSASVANSTEMQQAIIRALKTREWLVQSITPTEIKAEITTRGRHHAEIDIPYTASHFAIQYRSSWGLDEKDGTIHGNYNRWIENLRSSILQELPAHSLSQP